MELVKKIYFSILFLWQNDIIYDMIILYETCVVFHYFMRCQLAYDIFFRL